MSRNKIIISILATALVIGIFLWYNSQPGKLDGFAQCLKDKGAVFYGAFWCSHCNDQKDMFGKSVKFLPYVECSTPDGKGQLDVCRDKNVSGYPAWDFSDGTRVPGTLSLEEL